MQNKGLILTGNAYFCALIAFFQPSGSIIFSKMGKGVKTNSGAKKRFKLTGTGKVVRKHAFHSHILTKKSNKRKANLVKSTLVSDSDYNRVATLLNL